MNLIFWVSTPSTFLKEYPKLFKKKKIFFCIVTVNDIPANKKTLFQGRAIGCIDVVSSHEWSGLTHPILALDRFFIISWKNNSYTFPKKPAFIIIIKKKKLAPSNFLYYLWNLFLRPLALNEVSYTSKKKLKLFLDVFQIQNIS